MAVESLPTLVELPCPPSEYADADRGAEPTAQVTVVGRWHLVRCGRHEISVDSEGKLRFGRHLDARDPRGAP